MVALPYHQYRPISRRDDTGTRHSNIHRGLHENTGRTISCSRDGGTSGCLCLLVPRRAARLMGSSSQPLWMDEEGGAGYQHRDYEEGCGRNPKPQLQRVQAGDYVHVQRVGD
jgi:hypothetical protein